MKKNGKPRGRGNNGSGGAENLRNRKLYLSRLGEMELDEPPLIKRGKMPSAAELARLAAALARASDGPVSAGELANRARELWSASANSPFIEEMGEFVVRGLCVFDKADWERHCLTLVALLNEASGALPGMRTAEHHVRALRAARVKASLAVGQIWRRVGQAERGQEVIRALFPARSETEESRLKKLAGLLEFARGKVALPGSEAWALKYGIRCAATLVAAWMPLMLLQEEGELADTAAKVWMEVPHGVEVVNLDVSPVLARWLAVLRMQQVKEAKSRA